jgi:hypothetical protein
MTLASIFRRLRGDHGADRLAQASQQISEAQEKTRQNTVLINSGDRALRRMLGMMRLLMEAEGGVIPLAINGLQK